jgi:hypothetical protein
MQIVGGILMLIGTVLGVFSVMAVFLTWGSFVVLAFTQLIFLIIGSGWVIGWWILGAPLLLFFGGILAGFINLWIIAIGASLVE